MRLAAPSRLPPRSSATPDVFPSAETPARKKRLNQGACRKALQPFYLQLSFLLDAGVALETALTQMATQAEGTAMGKLAEYLRDEIRRGQSLPLAMQGLPRIFDPGAVAAVAAGYNGGKLPEVLEKVHDSLVQRQELNRQLRQAMTYPIFAITFMGCFVFGLFTWVVPRFMKLLEAAAIQPPPVTIVVIQVSDFLRENAMLLISGGAALVLAMIFSSRVPKVAWLRDGAFLYIPVVGAIVRAAALMRLGDYMALLYNAGVPLPQAMKLTAPALGNRYLGRKLASAVEALQQGRKLSQLLAESRVLPRLLVPVVSSGESSGRLGSAFDAVADWYRRQLPFLTRSLLALVEPLLLVLLVVVTGIIAVAVILPMVSLWKLSS